MATRVRGAAILWPHPVVLVGPSGAGKTGVLLAALGGGARLVDGEQVDLVEGQLRAASGRIRIRARHLREAPWAAARLGRLERARLRAGAALGSLPAVGARIARRAFVDVGVAELGPADPAPTGPVTLVVLAAGPGSDETRSLPPQEAVEAARPHVTGDPSPLGAVRAWRVVRRDGEGDRELAARIQVLLVGHREPA